MLVSIPVSVSPRDTRTHCHLCYLWHVSLFDCVVGICSVFLFGCVAAHVLANSFQCFLNMLVFCLFACVFFSLSSLSSLFDRIFTSVVVFPRPLSHVRQEGKTGLGPMSRHKQAEQNHFSDIYYWNRQLEVEGRRDQNQEIGPTTTNSKSREQDNRRGKNRWHRGTQGNKLKQKGRHRLKYRRRGRLTGCR